MSTQPTFADLASQSTDNLLHELKHYRCFEGPLDDLCDPYLKMMSTYRAFHNSIIKAIERGDADGMNFIRGGLIDAMYRGIPRLDVDDFREWAKLADMTHSLRRSASQHLLITIVRIQARGKFDSRTSKILAILCDCEEMHERVHNPESLV